MYSVPITLSDNYLSSTSYQLSVIVIPDIAPTIYSGMFNDQAVSLGNTVIYTLPIFIASFAWQSLTVTAFDGLIPIAPQSDYVSFNSINRILTFAPTTINQRG